VAATVFGALAIVAVRFWSRRAVLATGLALVGVALASPTLISPSTTYPQLGVALFVVGVGLGLAYDVILASVGPEQAGAAAAISETAYELGMALGIAMLGSIVASVYRGLEIAPGTLDVSHAKETLGAAHEAAATLPADKTHDLLTAAKSAFTEGLAIAAGVGSALLLASAAAVWLLLKPRPGPAVNRCVDAESAAALI
jgi:DHA2 family multidrug resistance protein-like MFS transporter